MAEADTVESAIEAVRSVSPDVVYLDIQLGTQSGFDVLDSVRGVASPLVIFTTAYSQHAVRAFEVQALDYLLKPLRSGPLSEQHRSGARGAEGARPQRSRRAYASAAGGDAGRPAPVKQILVREGERAFFIAADAIQRVSAAGNYVEVHAAGKVHLVRESLSDFIAQLDTAEFLRVHRSHVVRVGFIAELRPMFHGDYELVLKDGQR